MIARSMWWQALVVSLTISALSTLLHAEHAAAQDAALPVLAIQATPKGALPPMPLPMPASRNHNYWGFRLQAGQRRAANGSEPQSVAAGIDWQLRGGSVFGFTAGYQEGVCAQPAERCDAHAIFEARGRFGLLTGGPSLGALFGDYSATAVLGLEMGVGFSPKVAPEFNACTVDIGAPISLSMLQRTRLVTFLTPALAWSIDCSAASPPNDVSFATGFGVALQQAGLRGLDFALGIQKIFENNTGYQLGLSVSYVLVR